ncbi:hypothetical protein FGU71_04600 [Erythrobacter insulae]|uniref:FAS1-like dehydratase domain-containing protein n=1 Tax=Erythrobacter insulae TaxID=2584124 RepID=A0A547PAN0_9SPHN|nr:MaoC family dehydratase N-terminal domain-containing protein [Erythrobacter insulae]TRD11201.1 hypothetical protein FGU71_04600 [Erythrobacter insulae]
MGEYSPWIGREQQVSDRLSEEHAARWLATFDLPLNRDRFMPQGIHFALCTPDAATGQLGEDGHPRRDDSPDSFLPPIPLPRRMWASSDIAFRAPIAPGAAISRTSRIASIREKDGASGKLAFVNVEHQTAANGTLSVVETQTLVFRAAAGESAPLSPPEAGDGQFKADGWDAHRCVTPEPRLLFRYSALTFNTHRIHYDAPYARDIERYRGLVVHGPLTASLLLQLAARELGDNAINSFGFRGMSPAIAGEALHLVMRQADEGYELGAYACDGRQIMSARALI